MYIRLAGRSDQSDQLALAAPSVDAFLLQSSWFFQFVIPVWMQAEVDSKRVKLSDCAQHLAGVCNAADPALREMEIPQAFDQISLPTPLRTLLLAFNACNALGYNLQVRCCPLIFAFATAGFPLDLCSLACATAGQMSTRIAMLEIELTGNPGIL
jgi:hypothetical protein